MATFPTLKSGAVAQYPSDRTRQYATQVCRFLDSSEQRFPNYGPPLLRWVIKLDWLDEAELLNLETFFLSEAGQAGTFSFTDPWDGTVYPNCSLDTGMLGLEFRDVGRGVTQVVVKENR